MKKYICNPLWLLLLFVAFISSCDKEEIVFDHELPQFELRSDAILLEVIMPQGTGADEIIYIAGDFNGGQDAASGDLKWQMEKAANNDVKWGIYLYPEDFVNGKTLADGFYFVSKTQGIERTLQNGDALHQISAKVGTRTDITVTRWNAYFEEPEDPSEVIHDGYAVFVMDNTGWDALTLYAWGNDLPELFGGWPGISPTGSVEIKGITYKYFDTGEANKGLVYNLIFNDNGVGSQFDGPQNFTLDRDIYLEITESGWTEIDPDAVVIHDGYTIFIEDQSRWAETTIYAWGNDIPELFGSWPGILPTGSVEIKGVTYNYYDTGEANKGLVYNLIFNDNGVGSQFDGPQNFTLDRDIYLEITESGWTEIDPDAVVIHDGYTIFIEDQSRWAETTIYAWGNDIPELFGSWPGILPTGSVEIKGVTYNYYDTGEANKGLTYNLIMNNNNGGSQFDLAAVTLDRDYYFRITDIAGEEIDPNNPDGDSEPESEAAFVSNQNNFLK